MSTMLRIGPHDHGREMTLEEYLGGDYEEGYRELYVSRHPNPAQDEMSEYLDELLTIYKLNHRTIVKRLSSHCRVFVPGERKATCPEPDFALYNDSARARGQRTWLGPGGALAKRPRKGWIGFQDHALPISLRNIRIRTPSGRTGSTESR